MNRARPISPERIAQLFHLFGIDILERWRLCANGGEQVEAFEAAKAEAKIYHRRIAMELHPDKGGDGEKLKEVNAAWTDLQKVKMTPRQGRKSALNVGEVRGPVHTSVFVGVDFGGFGGVADTVTTNSAATSSAFWGSPVTHDVLKEMMNSIYKQQESAFWNKPPPTEKKTGDK